MPFTPLDKNAASKRPILSNRLASLSEQKCEEQVFVTGFKEIIGQESAISFLRSAYSARRLAHAYVFVGPDGVGKRTTALKFAQLLVCEDSKKTDEPCEKCPACIKARGSAHPDIVWVNTEGQFVKIDSIRQACRRLSLKGFESSYKVLIVPQAQYLNDESSNALLKTLEEPSADTVIILIAPSLRDILPTIASRCQRVVFSSLDRESLMKLLQEKFGVAKQESSYLAAMSDGSLGRALRYFKGQLFARKNSFIKEAFDQRLRLDDFIDVSKQERTQRDEKIEEVLGVLSSWFRDLLVAKACAGAGVFINIDREADIMRACRDLSFGEIELKLVAIADTLNEISRNVNARISLTKMRVELWKQ